MEKNLVELAAEIVQAQIASGKMSVDDIKPALEKTFRTLQKMQLAESTGTPIEETPDSVRKEDAPEKMSAADSIRKDSVICLECGASMRQLTVRHLKTHGLDQKEYKKKHGIPLKQPLSAISLTKARSKAARKRGIPENLARYVADKRRKKEEASQPAEES